MYKNTSLVTIKEVAVTKVVLSKNGEKSLTNELGNFCDVDKLALRYWIKFVEVKGIKSAQNEKSFDDHYLVGVWWGYRSAKFGKCARVIYKIIDSYVEIVEIEKITLSHDYRKK